MTEVSRMDGSQVGVGEKKRKKRWQATGLSWRSGDTKKGSWGEVRTWRKFGVTERCQILWPQ